MAESEIAALFPDGLAGLIYDCDGVMIDSAAGNRHLYNLVLGELGLPPITPEQEAFAFQATYEQALRFMTPPEMHSDLKRASAVVDYDKDILPKIKLMQGYREFVEKAHARGLKQAVDTNRTDFGIGRILEHFKLPAYFQPVISSSNTAPKPAPEGVEKIAADWGRKPGQILFIGDSPDDREAAKAGGAIFCAFGPGDLEGDLKVKSWPELAKILWGED